MQFSFSRLTNASYQNKHKFYFNREYKPFMQILEKHCVFQEQSNQFKLNIEFKYSLTGIYLTKLNEKEIKC